MNLKIAPNFINCAFSVLMTFAFAAYSQQITRIDFGVNVQTSPGNWNNFTVQNVAGTSINLIDITGIPTGEVLTLTDVFDLYERNNQGTQTPTGFPFVTTASRDSFFGESVAFNNGSGPSTETTGGFTLSGLEIGKYYSFTIFASRVGVTDNRETLYTIIGNSTPQTATLNAANNTSDVASFLNIQPDVSGKITIQATTGPNNTNPFGFYYLGAMQITKNTCSSTTIWNGLTWDNGLPDISKSVFIHGNYNTLNSSIGSFSACSLTVGNNASLSIHNNTYVLVQNDVTVDSGSTIDVQSTGSIVQLNDLGNVTNHGIMRVNKETAPANAWYEYTYWSSPVSGETIGQGLFESSVSRRFVFNGYKFLDAYAESNNNNTFTHGQDDIDDDGDDWSWVSGATIMAPGIGYAATHDKTVFSITPGFPKQIIYNFEGAFNNGIYTVPVYRNDSELMDTNWNFLGNPYPSAIDADLFLSANSNVSTHVASTKSINGAIFLWSQNTPVSATANGNEQLNFSNDDYAIINAIGECAGGDGITPSRLIPSCQGFFVSMDNYAPANLLYGNVYTSNVVFNNAMRVNGSTDNSQFFKNSNTKEKSIHEANKLWVNLTSDKGVFNQILIGYVDGATDNDDGMSYDTYKYPNKGVALYSTIEGSNKKFAIQGKNPKSLNEDEVTKLGFLTNIDVTNTYSLSLEKFQGSFFNENNVYLKDNLLNTLHNLTTSAYNFTSGAGEYNNRFEIVFNQVTLSTDDVDSNLTSFRIIELEDNQVMFTTSGISEIKTLAIFDLSGRKLYKFKGNSQSEIYNLSKLRSSVFIAKVELSNGLTLAKKAFKR